MKRVAERKIGVMKKRLGGFPGEGGNEGELEKEDGGETEEEKV